MPELLYETDGPVGTITLNRPERLNAVTPELVDLLDAALAEALVDNDIRVIRLKGAGRAFCAGYDLNWAAALMRDIDTASPWDPMEDYGNLSRFVNSYMSLWRSPKPVVAQVHGGCAWAAGRIWRCARISSCAPTTVASGTRRRGSGGRRPRPCGSTGLGWSARKGCC